MSKITKQLTDVKQGMTPNINDDNSILRVEHFDTTSNQLVPYRELSVSKYQTFDFISLFTPLKFVKYAGTTSNEDLYLLSYFNSNHKAQLMFWDRNNNYWDTKSAMDYEPASVFHCYHGSFYGLRSGSFLWKIENSGGGAVTDNFQALSYTYFADFITHSKDDLMYIPVDNKIYSCNGTTITLGITFPENYRISSINESGDYIFVVGFDTKMGKSVGYLWDRDSSLATLTAKYDLYDEIAYHSANLAGTNFIISLQADSSNTIFPEYPTMVIRYINGDKAKILRQYQYKALSIGGKYIANEILYFNAYIIPVGETSGHWIVFSIDSSGKLSIAQNVGINDAAGSMAEHPGIIRDGDGFWIAGGADGAWNTTNGYSTISLFETTRYRAKSLADSIDTIGGIILAEPLKAGEQIIVKTKKDGDTDWETVLTANDDGTVKAVFIGGELDSAKYRQFRIESTGGAVINMTQFDFEEKPEEVYD